MYMKETFLMLLNLTLIIQSERFLNAVYMYVSIPMSIDTSNELSVDFKL